MRTDSKVVLDNGVPRVVLTGASPLTKLEVLGAKLGHPNLYIKRDDLGEIGGGGNKLRKLEYTLGRAISNDCDTLITFGALQSNHARITAAVAAKFGLRCHLILSRKVARTGPHYECGGNIFLGRLLGAELHYLEETDDPLRYCDELTARLIASGARPYVVPFGGSDGLGAIGYAGIVPEIALQLDYRGARVAHLYHASGSGGTQAGLILGTRNVPDAIQVHGISVLSPGNVLAGKVATLVVEASEMLGCNLNLTEPVVDDRYIGQGYGIPNLEVVETLELVARTEGIILDPVYTGKAFCGLVRAIRDGAVAGDDIVVFIHTGGAPGLFAYADLLDEFGR